MKETIQLWEVAPVRLWRRCFGRDGRHGDRGDPGDLLRRRLRVVQRELRRTHLGRNMGGLTLSGLFQGKSQSPSMGYPKIEGLLVHQGKSESKMDDLGVNRHI